MLCRRAWQRLGPLLRRTYTPTSSWVRHASFGVPGGSTNLMFFAVCGGSLTAAMVYAYKTVADDIERYEDRLANLPSKRKAAASAPEAVTAAAERVSVAEAATAAEVIAESVSAPAVSETAAAEGEEAAAPAPEAAVDIEAAGEASPPAAAVAMEVAAAAEEEEEETPAEAATTESAGMEVVAEAPTRPAAEAEAGDAFRTETKTVPDLLAAAKILVGPPVEIAAASVGESSVMKAVRQVAGDGTGFDSAARLPGPDVPDVPDVPDTSPDVEEPTCAEVSSGSTEEAPAAATEEEESAAASSEEDEDVDEAETLAAATEEVTGAEEPNAADEAVPEGEALSGHPLDLEAPAEEAAAAASAEDPDKAASGVAWNCPETASDLLSAESESNEAMDCHCCAPSPGGEAEPPAVLQTEVPLQLLGEGAEDAADDSEEAGGQSEAAARTVDQRV